MRRLLIDLDASFDTGRRWALHPRVALRPEPFGALAYHYGSRRLTFLRSPELAGLVADLERFESVDDALAERVPAARRPAYLGALRRLAESEFICAA